MEIQVLRQKLRMNSIQLRRKKEKSIDLHYVKDMILLNGEIIIYISITKIIAIELEESDL